MDVVTVSLGRALRRSSSVDDQLRLLDNAYAGKTCVVVACGPSLNLVDHTRLLALLDGTLTIALKQAINVVGKHADFLCFNDYNAQRFRVPDRNTVKIYVKDEDSRSYQFNRATLTVPYLRNQKLLRDSVAMNGDFERGNFKTSTRRPRGRGIMFELALPLAVHLGVKRVVTIGWDISSSAGTNPHFDDAGRGMNFYSSLSRSSLATNRKPRFGILGPPARYLWTFAHHLTGKTYNRARMQPGEAQITAEGTLAMSRWLNDVGVDLVIISDRSPAHESIPRLTIDDLERVLGRESHL